MSHQTFFKTGRTKLRRDKRQTALDRKRDENANKAKVRRRDKGCRFPLCGCQRLGVSPLKAFQEVSHDKHKSMGGNPTGDRSTTAGMVQLCKHRHQDGMFSRHKGTLRVVFLTDRGFDGPVRWEIDLGWWLMVVHNRGTRRQRDEGDWWTIATETAVNVWQPFGPLQLERLQILAKMEV